MRACRDESQTKQSVDSSVNIYLKNTTERFGFKKVIYRNKMYWTEKKGECCWCARGGTVVNYLHVIYKSASLF